MVFVFILDEDIDVLNGVGNQMQAEHPFVFDGICLFILDEDIDVVNAVGNQMQFRNQVLDGIY